MAITQTPVAVAHGQGLNPSAGYTLLLNNGGSGYNTTGASFIRVAVSWYSATSASSASLSVTDNMGVGVNTYTRIAEVNAFSFGLDGINIAYFACTNPTVGSGHKFTVTEGTSTALYASVIMAAYAGVKTASPIEATIKSAVNNSSSLQPGSLTPSSSGALLDFICGSAAAGGVFSCDSGFATVDSVVGVSGQAVSQANFNLLQSTASAVNPTFSYTGSGPPTAVILVALDPDSAPPPPVTRFSSTLCMMGVG